MKASNSYPKDKGYYNKPINYSNVFTKVDDNALALINTTKYIYKDINGIYTYIAKSFDDLGNVYFEKTYL